MTETQDLTWSPPRQEHQGPPPVQVWVAGSQPQNRLTVLIRAILMIPHYVVLFFLAIAVAIIGFLGWWGALFTGRLPEYAAFYLTGYVRYLARLQAYGVLLTGKYPPFSLDDKPDYPVRIATTQERLNRFAVFFRFILAIPASLLGSFLGYGAFTIVLFITWVITLIAGRVPAPLHQAYAAVFRYQVRLNCYVYLLTPTYPVRGVFGDQRTDEPVQDEPVQEGSTQDGPDDPSRWRLLLIPAAKRLVIGFLVLGVVLFAGDVTYPSLRAGSAAGTTQTASTASTTVQKATASLERSMAQSQSAGAKCGQNPKCLTALDARSAKYFQDFASTVRSTPMPSNASALAGKLSGASTRLASDYTQMSRAMSTQQYTRADETDINADANQFQSKMAALQKVLSQDKKTNVGV